MLQGAALVCLVLGVCLLIDACISLSRSRPWGRELAAALIMLSAFAGFYSAIVWEAQR